MNEISMIYKIEANSQKIRILNEEFVKNNKDNCKIILNDKEQEICSEIFINENKKKKIKLKLN